jgi:hypothetical protein
MKASISLFMAMLVFFASVGIAKTTHFCMGYELRSELGIGLKSLDCGMGMPMNHNENTGDNPSDPKSCCENITEQLQVDDEVQLKKANFSFSLDFVVALVQIFVFGSNTQSPAQDSFANYFPPPIEQNLQVLYQSFLI